MWSHSPRAVCESELPSKEDMESLLKLYFEHHYPCSPMFVRKTFMRDFRQKRPTLHMIMLLNAIFSVACLCSDDATVKQDAAKYFGRAKLILDETYHVSNVSTIQALLIMSHYQSAHAASSASYVYSGIAYRMAFVSQLVLSRLLLTSRPNPTITLITSRILAFTGRRQRRVILKRT